MSAAAEEAFEKAGLLGELSRALERERLKLVGLFVHEGSKTVVRDAPDAEISFAETAVGDALGRADAPRDELFDARAQFRLQRARVARVDGFHRDVRHLS